jgi:hypothetical protein
MPLAELIRGAVNTTRLGSRFSSGELIAESNLSDLQEFGNITYLAGMTEQETNLLTDGIIPGTPSRNAELRRIGTYGSVLGVADMLGRVPTEDDFFEEVQKRTRSLPNALHGALTGWLRYLTRDAIAVGHEYLLQELIGSLLLISSTRSTVPSAEVINHLLQDTQTHNDALDLYGLRRAGENAGNITFQELYERIDASTAGDRITEHGLNRWSGPLSELALIKSIEASPARALTLLPVIWCLATIRAASWPDPISNPFEGRSGIGWNAIGIHEVISPGVKRFIGEHWKLDQVMSELALRTIDQHLRVSWSRMAVDIGHDVALLTTEADRWQSRPDAKHVQDYRAGRSASRLYQVVSWLQQLGLVSKAGLTPRGKNVYERAVTVLTAEVNREAA